MLFNSIEFLIFLPIVLLLYYIIPQKFSKYWLLAASYFFYMCWNVKYSLLLLATTVVTYFCGLMVERANGKNHKRIFIFLSLLINLGILFFFKYFNFSITLVAQALQVLHVNVSFRTFDVLLPVGISFYTFQAIGYTVDIYRGEIKAEKNFFTYALFVSFFPQLVAGPIERSKNLISQLKEKKKFDYEKVRDGLVLTLWGFFLKIVLADRMAMFVDKVYANPVNYRPIFIILATVLFGLQIYCDFYGYSIIALGAAKMLGIELMENFNAPYLSTSVENFWRGWHISLTSWFKDYVYIPLGGNRKGKVRKWLNKLIVFFLSGLWHGASLSFVLWGVLNGVYQIAGEILRPIKDRIRKGLGKVSGKALLVAEGLITFALIDFSWIFFRANNLKNSFIILKAILRPAPLQEAAGLFEIMDGKNLICILVCLLILLLSDICRKKGIAIRAAIMKKHAVVRCLFIALTVVVILVFGKYGPMFDAGTFIYFNF